MQTAPQLAACNDGAKKFGNETEDSDRGISGKLVREPDGRLGVNDQRGRVEVAGRQMLCFY